MDKLRIKISRLSAAFLHGILSQSYLNYLATFEDTAFVEAYWQVQKKLVGFLAGEKSAMQMTFTKAEYLFMHTCLQEYLQANEVLNLFRHDCLSLYQQICLWVA